MIDALQRMRDLLRVKKIEIARQHARIQRAINSLILVYGYDPQSMHQTTAICRTVIERRAERRALMPDPLYLCDDREKLEIAAEYIETCLADRIREAEQEAEAAKLRPWPYSAKDRDADRRN